MRIANRNPMETRWEWPTWDTFDELLTERHGRSGYAFPGEVWEASRQAANRIMAADARARRRANRGQFNASHFA